MYTDCSSGYHLRDAIISLILESEAVLAERFLTTF
ncbi:hypothetical protein BH23GEM8_BH23GEM8_19410 [soil metagenome]|jgi:hypothetical protein